MPALADTTIRLLGQEPLAGRLPTAEQLRIAAILDRAGYAYLEVSGGGCFDSAVRRGVESPWERIRALKAHVKTPLGLALRGRFLVGSRPVDNDFIRRFIASAAANGIDVFRLHDPLNDVSNLREAAEAARAGAELIACAVYPIALTLHRVSGEALAEALAGLDLECDIDVSTLWAASDLVDEYIGDEPVTPLAPRIAVRAAQHNLPASLVMALDTNLRAQAAGARLDETIAELVRIRSEVGWPPLASPIGQVLGSQALLNVLSASRYSVVVDELRSLVEGHLGTTPAPIEKSIERIVSLTADPDSVEDTTAPPLQEVRAQAEGLASSEEELLLLGLFGDNAEPLLRTIRGRSSGDESLAAGGVDQARAERIRELVRIVQETGIGEVTIEESGMRVSVRRTEDPEPLPSPSQSRPESPLAALEDDELAPVPPNGLVRVEAPMVGTFYRASQPGAPPFVEEGQPVGAGQTLCILEAMKLMNEVKADVEGIVRAIHVENASPVEFGQLLFELEPVVARPLDAL